MDTAAARRSIDISIVVMAYNEVENLESAVTELAGALADIPGTHELVLIDDGSTDGTGALADELSNRYRDARTTSPAALDRERQGREDTGIDEASASVIPEQTGQNPIVRVIHHARNLGLGGAYRTGFQEARGRFVMFYAADGQFPARFIAPFRQKIASADMVLGFRPGRRESLIGDILSLGERALYFVLFGPMPKFHGLVMFRRTLLDDIHLESRGRGWVVLMEFILRVHRAGYRIVHHPIEIRPRSAGESKVNNLPTIWANLKQMVALRRSWARTGRPPATSNDS